MHNRLRTLLNQELYDKNLIQAVNNRVMPIAAYLMNACNNSKRELDELDQMIK